MTWLINSISHEIAKENNRRTVFAVVSESMMMIGWLYLTLTTEQRKSVSSLFIGFPKKKQHCYHGAI